MADKLTAPLVESLTEAPEGKTFPVFDGAAYATVPAWTPSGAEWKIEMLLSFSSQSIGVQTNLLSDADSSTERLVKFLGNQIAFGYTDDTGAAQQVGSGYFATRPGDVLVGVRADANQVSCEAVGVDGHSTGSVEAAADASDINLSHLASNNAGDGSFLFGQIRHLRLIDHTPLQGARFMPGDGVSRHAAIPEIALAGDFEIEGSFTLPDASGIQILLGRVSDTSSYIATFNGPLRFQAAGQAVSAASPNPLIADRHYSFKARRTGLEIGLSVDNGTESVNVGASAGVVYFDCLLRNSVGNWFGGGFANLTIRDLETNQEWQYSNRNDGGNKLKNTGNTGSAFDGVWYQGGSPMTNAAADAARTRLPMISRHYLFDEPGRIKEVLGGGADATLINLDASDWQAE